MKQLFLSWLVNIYILVSKFGLVMLRLRYWTQTINNNTTASSVWFLMLLSSTPAVTVPGNLIPNHSRCLLSIHHPLYDSCYVVRWL